MLHIRHLTKYYTKSKPIISDMNLSFASTGLNIIIGKSGCGKTTLLNMIGTMDQDYIGSIELDGVELSTLNYKKISDYRRYDSAYIFQINSLFEHLTVRQNIQLVLDLQDKEVNVEELLEKVGLKGFADKKVKYLSGGERQRVGIARAIARDSKIILADEPTSALDSKNGHRILQLLKEISKDKLVIVVTHDTKKAFLYADRVIKLVDGRVVEDDIINQSDKEATPVVRKSAKSRVLLPIFFEQFRKSLIINLFIILLITAVLGVLNIANEQAKVKSEYDRFNELQNQEIPDDEIVFSALRTLLTQEANGIHKYHVVKNTDKSEKYKYFKNATAFNNNITTSDYATIEKILGNYNLNYYNSNYGGLIIDEISRMTKETVTINNDPATWREQQRTTYSHYLYKEGNQYNLKYGRLPKANDEILITDSVADNYLRILEFDATDLSIMLNQEMIIRDIYGKGYRDLSTTNAVRNYNYNIPYWYTVPKTYKVVGIIDTNQLQYYNFSVDARSYYINDKIYQLSGNDKYLNPLYMQPEGYIVFKEELDAAEEYTLYDFPVQVNRVMYEGKNVSNGVVNVSVFKGYDDYRGYLGYYDNIEIDYSNRLYAKTAGVVELENNQIVISRELLEKYTGLTWTVASIRNNYATLIQGQEITLSFETLNGFKDVTFEIAGVSINSDTLFYVSKDMYRQIKKWNEAENYNALAVGLESLSAKERIKVIDELYEAGYLLNPISNIPGAFLEFFPSQGEIEIVDDEGFTEKKNISLYNVFSLLYNNKDMDSMNATLEIVDSIANFCLFLGISLSLGFIYLKEKRQKMNIMKLSQIGVSSKSIINMNILTYIVVALLIGFGCYFVSQFAINYINDLFTLTIDKGIVIHRFRVVQTNTTLITSILALVITALIGIIASVVIVKKSRR